MTEEIVKIQTKCQTVFRPDCWEWILGLPFKTKNLGKYKKAVTACAYVLNHVRTARYTREEKTAPISYFTMGILCGGDKHTWSKLQTMLLDYEVIQHDGESMKGEKSFHYSEGTALKGAAWTRSKEVYTFSLPMPLHDLNDSVEGFTVDASQVGKALDFTAEKREWSSDEKAVWGWYLEEGFHTGYTVAKTGRIYGGWSNVPRELRGTFLIEGKPVLEVDVSNCHPLLLANLYGDSAAGEKARYCALVESGGFYEDVMSKTGMCDREEVKKLVMAFLCGKSKAAHVPGYFEANFPFLAGVIASHQKKLYKSVAHILQKCESDLIVGNLCEEFPAVSMHDGVIVAYDIAEDVRDRAKVLIKDHYGLNASVKIENKRIYEN